MNALPATVPLELNNPDRACRATDPDTFFPVEGERRETLFPRMEKTARELCAVCPILGACRDAGYVLREVGLWGGVLHIKHRNKRNELERFPLIVGNRPTP